MSDTPRPPSAAASQARRSVRHSLDERLFETSLDLILVVDRGGMLLRVSPSAMRILGRKPEEMVGQNATQFLYHEDLDKTRAEMRRARLGHLTTNFDCRYVHQNGSTVPLAWTGVWSEADQKHFFIGRDMSERIAAEERLRQAQKMEAIGHLTGGVAHDFNNLLLVIQGSIELVEEDLRGEHPELSHELQRALRASQRGAALTRSLLAFARKQPLAPSRVDVNRLVPEMVELLRRTLGEAIEIKLAAAPKVWSCDVDAGQLQNAIINLAVNARDAMPSGGKLTIETGNADLDGDYASHNLDVTPGKYVILAVSDTGAGMPPDVLRRAFDPFFTTKSTTRGTGLGLSMVYGFVKQSGGHVKIYSELGFGTTIKMYLPRSTGGAAHQPLDIDADAMPGGAESVLVVEDDADVRELTTRQLTSLGYRVLAAGSGDEALAVLAGTEPDLLLTDVILSGSVNGKELADAARRRYPQLRVLFMSGYTEDAILHHGRLEPDVQLLSKPFGKRELAFKLRAALSR